MNETVETCPAREDGGGHLIRYRAAGFMERGDENGLVWECAYCRVPLSQTVHSEARDPA